MHKNELSNTKSTIRLSVMESIHGTYMYHLSETGENMNPALCGNKNIMKSGHPMRLWNMEPTHIRTAFCTKCHECAEAMGVLLPARQDKTITF